MVPKTKIHVVLSSSSKIILYINLLNEYESLFGGRVTLVVALVHALKHSKEGFMTLGGRSVGSSRVTSL